MKGIICHILHLSPLSLEFLMICRPLLTVYNILLLRSHCMNIHLTLQRFSVAVTFLHTLFKPEKFLHQINRCMHYLNTENAHKRSIIAQNLRRRKEYYTTVEPLLCAINCTEIKVFFVRPELASAKRREALLVLKTTPTLGDNKLRTTAPFDILKTLSSEYYPQFLVKCKSLPMACSR